MARINWRISSGTFGLPPRERDFHRQNKRNPTGCQPITVSFGSIALVADGMHMSTHAGALLLAALAYTYARKHANDSRFTFGTGKFGDLAGFTSAIILAMIALLIGYEAVCRLFAPVPIQFAEAIPIAALGLG
jgi:cation diffusion facilitator family transporter